MKRTFVVCTQFAELLDLCIHLKYTEKQDVLLFVEDANYKKVGEGIIEHVSDWHDCIGKGYFFLWDGCSHGKTQDYLRSIGEIVFGGSEKGDELENDRQVGQKLFKEAGFNQPFSRNFTSIEEAIQFVNQHKDERYILKQNADAPKSINYIGKFDKNVDMLKHLESLKTTWKEAEFGPVDFDLMGVVEGTETAASAFWNGHDWMRDKEGRVAGYLNWEFKKEFTDDLGTVTGETGSVFLGTNEDNKLFSKIIVNPVVEKYLSKIGFRGVFDINGTVTPDGEYTAFEATMRFGIPATSYGFIEGLQSSTADLLEAVAKGEDKPVNIKQTIGEILVVAAKPYPLEGHVSEEETSVGEELWLTENGNPSDAEIWSPRFKHLHLYNFYRDEETGEYKVATSSGYMLTCTATGNTVADAREKTIEEVKSKIYLSGAKWRNDIGKRVEEFVDGMAP